MSQSATKAVHPFFQKQKKKFSATRNQPKAHAAAPKSSVKSPLPTCESVAPESPCYNNKAEGSKPRHMAFPTFYSDLFEKETTFDHFGQPHCTKQKKPQDQHEFSRLHVFDSTHVTDKVFEPWQPLVKRRTPPVVTNPDLSQPFPRRRRRCQPFTKNKGDQAMLPSIETQAELERYLDTQFPFWHRYTSCVELCQSIFCTKKKEHEHDHRLWTEKYRPRTVKGLMGDRHHHAYLKDWLHQMKIAPISASSKPSTTNTNKKKKKQKKVVVRPNLDHLDEEEFIHHLSLYDHHDDQDDDFVMQNKKKATKEVSDVRSNVILVTGDHGVGKTASVYTAAEELGYEVFEINAGSRRSGKDVMAMVGEMTKSHLVAFGKPETTVKKKKKLNPYFAPTQSITKPSHGLMKHFAKKKTVTCTSTKQSLILLEEVDLLFEEDKGFWPSVIELSQKSKRPIIMTCNDADHIPFENLSLQIVLDLKPPSEHELLPYLWLVCFAEGYVVNPADLICLMALLGRDIRQLLQTLSMYAGQDVFGKYLGFTKDMDLVEMKEKCVPSRAAVDTFRLALSYLDNQCTTTNGEQDELEKIVQALDNNAFIDTWLGYKENGHQVCQLTEDQMSGYTVLYKQDQEDIQWMESTLTVLNSQTLDSSSWRKFVTEESSHYEELNDARIHTFEDYKEAIEKLLPISYIYQPYETILALEYIPFIQAMIYHDHQNKSTTRSKRRRLYLPLNQEAIQNLTTHKSLVDETEFWINQLNK